MIFRENWWSDGGEGIYIYIGTLSELSMLFCIVVSWMYIVSCWGIVRDI
jgi:hypothetical protein